MKLEKQTARAKFSIPNFDTIVKEIATQYKPALKALAELAIRKRELGRRKEVAVATIKNHVEHLEGELSRVMNQLGLFTPNQEELSKEASSSPPTPHEHLDIGVDNDNGSPQQVTGSSMRDQDGFLQTVAQEFFDFYSDWNEATERAEETNWQHTYDAVRGGSSTVGPSMSMMSVEDPHLSGSRPLSFRRLKEENAQLSNALQILKAQVTRK